MYSTALIFAIIIVIVAVVAWKLGRSAEGFTPITTDAVSRNGRLNINLDDTEFSQYNNISLSEDIDMMQQRLTGLDFSDSSNDPENAATADEALYRGNPVFQPATMSGGVTPTSHAGMDKFTLAGPAGLPMFDSESSYDISLTGAADVDELLARKQQHRSAINEKAIQGYVRSTRNIFQKYFTDELAENEQREWWDAESLDFDTDFNPE
jgi:hypothetical protein